MWKKKTRRAAPHRCTHAQTNRSISKTVNVIMFHKKRKWIGDKERERERENNRAQEEEEKKAKKKPCHFFLILCTNPARLNVFIFFFLKFGLHELAQVRLRQTLTLTHHWVPTSRLWMDLVCDCVCACAFKNRTESGLNAVDKNEDFFF